MSPPQAIARTILDGFEKRWAQFRALSVAARKCFERGDRAGAHELSRVGIGTYDERVQESVAVGAAPVPRRAHRRDALAPGEAGASSGCSTTTSGRSAPRPSTTRSPAGCSTGPTTGTSTSSGGRRWPRSSSRPTTSPGGAGTRPPGISSPPSTPSPGASGCRCRSRTCGATCARCCWPSGQHLPGRRERQLNFQVQVLSSLFFRDHGCLRRGAAPQRQPADAVRRLPAPLGVGTRAVRGRAPAQARAPGGALQPLAGLLHRRHGRAVRVRGLPQPADAGEVEGRAVHLGGPAEAGQDALLPGPASRA